MDAIENPADTADDCILKMQKENAADEIAELQARLNQPELTAEERKAVLIEITERIRANK